MHRNPGRETVVSMPMKIQDKGITRFVEYIQQSFDGLVRFNSWFHDNRNEIFDKCTDVLGMGKVCPLLISGARLCMFNVS